MRADLAYCDFMILAPLRLEVESLRDALTTLGWKISKVPTSDFPCLIEANIVDSGVAHFQRHLVIVQLNDQGVLNASVDTARILELYEPGYVISFGIAGTFDDKDAPLGAVVMPTSLFYYEPSKDTKDGTESRMDPIPLSKDLLNDFRNLEIADIRKVHGPFASGEKLFADIASTDRQRILSTNSKILGVEMEAAGVGRSVEKLWPSAKFFVLKGISDRADADKNLVSPEVQERDRANAAFNVASCMAQLATKAPLRRSYRSMPRPSEDRLHQKALSEATLISETLEPYGIKVNFAQLNACLYGRRGSIPAYFHWLQHAEALHWIDFKILTAIKALPSDIVTPVPLVTIAADDVTPDQQWYSSVKRVSGVYPITNAQIKQHLDEISSWINREALPSNAEEEIRAELQRLQLTNRPEILLNVLRYMLGQFCHRRMFVFVWESSREKWKYLSRAFGIWFAMFEWETMNLDGKPGKQEAPGKDILIEPGSYSSLKKWLNTSPPREVLLEFLEHFKCHCSSFPLGGGVEHDPATHIKDLMELWETSVLIPT
jgi:nucleoside phosphorylase